MKRWNGWGDDGVRLPLAPRAAALLRGALGEGRPRPDASFAEALAAAAPSRLPPAAWLDATPEARLRHARGQSFPDWVALRSGHLGPLPDAVSFPDSHAAVQAALHYAAETGARVIPFGGGTSVVGHLSVPAGPAPVVTLSLARLSGLRWLDERSRLACLGAGTAGPEVEAALRARGFTLGHFPQSFEYSTLGGWVATRSSGQESLGYGRIEQLFAGGRLLSPGGTLELPPLPASAAGPDLRHAVLGSEGRLGVLTDVIVRVRPLPERDAMRALFFPDWDSGMEAARRLAQSGLRLSMLRLSDAGETRMALASSPRPRIASALERYLAWRGAGETRCQLLLGCAGAASAVRATVREALSVAGRQGAVRGAAGIAQAWRRHRFRTPYLRNTLWESGYGVDTVETAGTWTALSRLQGAVEAALRDGLRAEGEAVHLFTHVSHVYPDGASLYTTYAFRLADGPEEDLRRWRHLKEAASRAIVACGGTISHHHGVGTDHRAYLPAEKGALGMAALGDLVRRFDPQGLMNPGKLVA